MPELLCHSCVFIYLFDNMSIHKNIIFGHQNLVLPVHMNYGRHFLEQIIDFEDKVALVSPLFIVCLKLFAKIAKDLENDYINISRRVCVGIT